ncbi:thioredoxin-1 [bacterium BMS3Abin04]|nr:thioredoxin-1 [bacterium BMS3Abin04]
MSLVTITDDNFEKEVLKSDIPVIIDFWAEWCSPCRLIAPIMDELAEEFNGKIKVGKLDVDSNQQTAIKYGVRSIPTVLMLKDGEVKEVVIGAVPKAMFVDKINSLL